MSQYMRSTDFKNDHERHQHLLEIHLAMAEQLFCWHGLHIVTADVISSEAFVGRGEINLLFETYFDESENTCHRIYDLSEARRLIDEQISGPLTQEIEIQERRAQIRLVKSNQGPES